MPDGCLWRCNVCSALLPAESDLQTHLRRHDNQSDEDMMDLAVTWYAVKAQVYRQVLDLQRFCPEIQLQAAAPPPEYEAPTDSEAPQIQNEAACSEDTDSASEHDCDNEAPMNTDCDDVTLPLTDLKSEPQDENESLVDVVTPCDWEGTASEALNRANVKTLAPVKLNKKQDSVDVQKDVDVLDFDAERYMNLQCLQCKDKARSFAAVELHRKLCFTQSPGSLLKFCCLLCPVQRRVCCLSDDQGIQQHIQDAHFHRYYCRVCGEFCHCLTAINTHLRQEHGRVSCPTCHQSVLKQNMSQHMYQAHNVHRCNQCRARFLLFEDLIKHVSSVHQGFKCAFCSKSFLTAIGKSTHVRQVHSEKGPPVSGRLKSVCVVRRGFKPARVKVVLRKPMKVVHCTERNVVPPDNASVVNMCSSASLMSSLPEMKVDPSMNMAEEEKVDLNPVHDTPCDDILAMAYVRD